MEESKAVPSPRGTYIVTLTTLENLDVEVRLVRSETSEVVVDYILDNGSAYLDEIGITQALFSEDERYLVINNYYYNPILVWDTHNGTLHLEIRDVEDVMSAEIESGSILRIEDGQNNWVRWDIAQRAKLD